MRMRLTSRFSSSARGAIGAIVAASTVGLVSDADARITKIVTNYNPATPTLAYGGASFGAVGQYEVITGTAYGEVDPKDPLDSIIQDIGLAPVGSDGMVQYSTQIVIIRPVNLNNGNSTMLFEIVNRGNMLNPGFFNVGATTNVPQGDGFLEKQGFTLVWAGWQADLIQPPGGGLVAMFPDSSSVRVPIAHYPSEDDPIKGPVRSEFTVSGPTSTRPLLDESSSNTAGYATNSLDNSHDSLTMRVHQNDPKVLIANTDWAYADCTSVAFPGTPDRQTICLRNGFDTNHIYELLYTGRDPIVMGVGLAALRDVGSFLRYSTADDFGNANPLAGGIKFGILPLLNWGAGPAPATCNVTH